MSYISHVTGVPATFRFPVTSHSGLSALTIRRLREAAFAGPVAVRDRSIQAIRRKSKLAPELEYFCQVFEKFRASDLNS